MVSVVVANWNGRHHLERCLAAVLAQNLPPAEVILADNHSDDGSRELVAARFPQVAIVDTGYNGGPGRARNAGAARAVSERVLLLDADVELLPGALACLSAALDAHPRAAAVQARTLDGEARAAGRDELYYDRADLHYLGLLVLRDFHEPIPAAAGPTEHAQPVGAVVALCVLVDRARYLEVGGFREELLINFEDTELSWRLRLAGYELWQDPGALAVHHGGTAGVSMRRGRALPHRRTWLHARNRWLVLGTCMRARTLLLTLPAQLGYAAVHATLALSNGQLGAWLRGTGAAVGMVPELRRWRRAVLARRVAGVRDRDLLAGGPLSLQPGIADRGLRRALHGVLDLGLRIHWALVRRLCG